MLARAHAVASALVLACLVAGCEQDLRVPYIPPKLANWRQPYRGIAGLKVHVFVTGHLRLSEAQVVRGGSFTASRDLPVFAILIEHPTQGLILFNTGSSPQRSDAASGWWNVFTVEVLPGKGIKAQLTDAGFKPEAVRWIILSTMRSEHTGEVESFPNARVVVAKAEHAHARQAPEGYSAPDFDDVPTWKFIDFTDAKPLATFPAHVDLFGDGSCELLDASGSTPGTMALLVRLHARPLLLADDMAAVRENVRYAAKPAAAYDLESWWDRIWRLKRFMDLVPELLVLPGHELEAVQAAQSNDIILHRFAPPAGAPATPTPGLLRRLLPPM